MLPTSLVVGSMFVKKEKICYNIGFLCLGFSQLSEISSESWNLRSENRLL